jgi:anti-sigma regulatory factor (Ser/Thr protein kinase)
MASNELGQATLAAGPEAPGTARAALSSWLAPHVTARALDDARLMVSELVSNSVQHAVAARDAPIHVSAEKSNGTVHVEVADLGRAAHIAAGPLQAEMQDGFGLYLVEVLAARWGVTHQPGTHVWFEMPVKSRA